jgi:phosphatidate cytidylyltransferase
MIRSIPGTGVYLVWFVFICSWLTDTFAYFTGRLFGKTKLSPVISPKKTVEGSIGGIVFSTAGCIAYSIYLNSAGIIFIPIVHALIIGFASSIISQIGDLAASAIKRAVGVKDYGKIMPGHGGMLDRFDSILFVAPLIYYYMVYILKLV